MHCEFLSENSSPRVPVIKKYQLQPLKNSHLEPLQLARN